MQSEATTLARKLANELFGQSSPIGHCQVPKDNHTCVSREYRRPVTAAEAKRRSETPAGQIEPGKRPTWALDPDRMCSSCRAYWYAEMAALTLEMEREP